MLFKEQIEIHFYQTSQANGSELSALPWSGDVPNRLDAGKVWPEFSAA